MKNIVSVLVGCLMVVGSVLYVNVDHKYTVVHFAATQQAGYEGTPETFKVEISPAMAFHLAVEKHPFNFILAVIFILLAVVWAIVAYFELIDLGKANVIYDYANQIWFTFVVLATIFFFVNHGAILGNNYFNFDKDTYTTIRGNTETTPFASKSMDEFFKNKINIIQ